MTSVLVHARLIRALQDGYTALMEASAAGQLDVVRFLAKECEGVNLNAADMVSRGRAM